MMLGGAGPLEHLEGRQLVDNAFPCSACALQRLHVMSVALTEPISLPCVQSLARLPHFGSLRLRSFFLCTPTFFPDVHMMRVLAANTQWR